MAYALQSMLKIRGMREDRAQTELAGARVARNRAEREHDERASRLAEYDRTKDERRDRVYDAVMGRLVKREDLDRARDAVSRIDEEGMLLAEAEVKAKDVLAKRESEAESARIRFVAASKNLAKIEEHRRAWEEEDLKMQEMLADAEMDEFAGRRLVGDDDDSLD